MKDDERLIDIAIRIAIFVEAVKLWQIEEFHFYLTKLETELEIAFAGTKLEELSKYKLNKFIVKIRKAYTLVFNKYTSEILKNLQEFMVADLEINRRAYVTNKIREKKPLSDKESIEYLMDTN